MIDGVEDAAAATATSAPSVPWAMSVGRGQVDADAADDLGRPGPGQLLLHDVVLDRPGAAAAVLGRPRHPDQAGRGQLGLPLATEGHLVGQVVVLGRQPDAPLPRQVGPQPGPHLGPELLLLGSSV